MKPESLVAVATAFALLSTPLLAEAKGARFGGAGRSFNSFRSPAPAPRPRPAPAPAPKPAPPAAAPAKAPDKTDGTAARGGKGGGGGVVKPPAGGGGGLSGDNFPARRLGAGTVPAMHSNNNWLLWYLLLSGSNNSNAHRYTTGSDSSVSSAYNVESFACQPSQGQSAQSWYLQCHSAAGGPYKLEFRKGCGFKAGEAAQNWVQRCATRMKPDW